MCPPYQVADCHRAVCYCEEHVELFVTSSCKLVGQFTGQERRERMARDLEQIRREVEEEEEEMLRAQRVQVGEHSQTTFQEQERPS